MKVVFSFQIKNDCRCIILDESTSLHVKESALKVLCEMGNSRKVKGDADLVFRLLGEEGLFTGAAGAARASLNRCHNLLWRLAEGALQSQEQCWKNFNLPVLELAVSAVEDGDGTSLPHVLRSATLLLGMDGEGEPPPVLCRLLSSSLSAAFEMRKNDHFWPALEAWVGLACSGGVLCCPDEEVQDCLSSSMSLLLREAEAIPGIAVSLALGVARGIGASSRFQRLPRCLREKTMGSLLCAGPLFRKDLQVFCFCSY